MYAPLAFVEGSSCPAQQGGGRQLVPPAALRLDWDVRLDVNGAGIAIKQALHCRQTNQLCCNPSQGTKWTVRAAPRLPSPPLPSPPRHDTRRHDNELRFHRISSMNLYELKRPGLSVYLGLG